MPSPLDPCNPLSKVETKGNGIVAPLPPTNSRPVFDPPPRKPWPLTSIDPLGPKVTAPATSIATIPPEDPSQPRDVTRPVMVADEY